MKVLVTGITGFAGSHMSEFLLQQPDVQIFGIYRRRSRLEYLEGDAGRLHMIEPGVASVETLQRAFAPDKINLIDCDLLDAFSVHKLIGAVRPDRIFHLAAQSHVPTSWNSPSSTLMDNILGQLNLFEAVR